jgi:hypothetical protein
MPVGEEESIPLLLAELRLSFDGLQSTSISQSVFS